VDKKYLKVLPEYQKLQVIVPTVPNSPISKEIEIVSAKDFLL